MTGLVLLWRKLQYVADFGCELGSGKSTRDNGEGQRRFNDRPQTGFVQIDTSGVCLTHLPRLGEGIEGVISHKALVKAM